MSYTREDYAYDEYMLDHGEDLYREDLLAEFETERLQSYYKEHPDIALPAMNRLAEARNLLAGHHAASCVFSVSAIECGLKLVLLRPLVHGLVHRESLAELVAKNFEVRRDKLYRLLLMILGDLLQEDMTTLTRQGVTDPLLRELAQLADQRNRILHAGEAADAADAQHAEQVAAFVLEDLLPRALTGLGLQLQGGKIEEKPSPGQR